MEGTLPETFVPDPAEEDAGGLAFGRRIQFAFGCDGGSEGHEVFAAGEVAGNLVGRWLITSSISTSRRSS